MESYLDFQEGNREPQRGGEESGGLQTPSSLWAPGHIAFLLLVLSVQNQTGPSRCSVPHTGVGWILMAP